MSEKEHGGYFNPILESFLPKIPKHHKYALIIGAQTFHFSNPAIYNKIFAPAQDAEHQKLTHQSLAFIDSYHSGIMGSFALNKSPSKSEKMPVRLDQVDLERELQTALQELKKMEEDKNFLEKYHNKKLEDERQAREKAEAEERQKKYDLEHPYNSWDDYSPN